MDTPFLNGGLSLGRTLVPWGNIIKGLLEFKAVLEIVLKNPRLSFVIFPLFIDIDPIFFKYYPKIGIDNSSLFKIKIGELNMVCRKKVSNIDWCDAAMKNFSFLIIFSLPLIKIWVDKKNLKQKPVQWPINLPPKITIFLGKKNEGKKIIEIAIIPKKKKNENI